MPIDLSEYTPKKRVFLKAAGLRCIYVVAPAAGTPCKIGVATDMVARFVTLQGGNWIRLEAHHLLWCPGSPVAYRIEGLTHNLLDKAGKGISGEWFDITEAWAWKTVMHIAKKHYPTVRFSDHTETIKRLKNKPLDKRDHVGSVDIFQKSAISGANQA